MKNKALPERQLQIMQVLWGSSKAMTAAEIMTVSELGINTVQASLRSLIKKNYIKQDEIVYSGTVLTSTYVPVVSEEEYLMMACNGLMEADTSNLVIGAFVRKITDISVLEELEKMIMERRKELKENDRK